MIPMLAALIQTARSKFVLSKKTLKTSSTLVTQTSMKLNFTEILVKQRLKYDLQNFEGHFESFSSTFRQISVSSFECCISLDFFFLLGSPNNRIIYSISYPSSCYHIYICTFRFELAHQSVHINRIFISFFWVVHINRIINSISYSYLCLSIIGLITTVTRILATTFTKNNS